MDQLVGTAAFLVLNASNVLVARAALAAFPGYQRWHERALVATAAFLMSAIGMVTLLGMTGWLTRPALVGLAALAGLAAARVRPRAAAPVPGGRIDWLEDTGPVALAILAAAISIWVVQGLFLGIHYRGDDLAYHGLNFARWLRDGSLGVQVAAVQGYYPSNPAALALWFAIPFGSDAYAGLAGLGYAVLLTLGVFTLLDRIRVEPAVAALIVAALLWSPQLRSAGFDLTAVDLAGPALVMAALCFTLPSRGARSLTAETVLAGWLAGSATGGKPTFLIGAAVVAVMLVVRNHHERGPQFAASRLVIFGLALAAGGGYWYARNAALTGNPLFPMETMFFPGTYSRASLHNTTLAGHFAEHGSARLLWPAIRILSDWPRALLGLAVLGYLGALVKVARSIRGGSTPEASVAVRLALAGLAWLVCYPWFPYSGGNQNSFAAATVHPHVARYVILTFACGLTLAGFVGSTRTRRLILLVTGCVLAFEQIQGGRVRLDASLLGPLAVGLGALVAFDLRARLRLRRRPADGGSSERLAPAWGLVFLLLFGALEPRKLEANRLQMGRDFRMAGFLEAVESWPDGTATAVVQINDCYPLFGRRMQHDVVQISRSGRRRVLLHASFAAERSGGRPPPDPFDARSLVDNLRAAGAHRLMLLAGGVRASSELRELVTSHDDTEPDWEDRRLTVWRFEPGGSR